MRRRADDSTPRDGATEQSDEGRHGGDVYRYEASGIEERRGRVPVWLTLVVFGLLVWAVYYTIRYWSSA